MISNDTCGTCKEHSGVVAEIEYIKEDVVKQGKDISRMDTKLNMIIGAIILSPFIWSVLTGLLKTASTGG